MRSTRSARRFPSVSSLADSSSAVEPSDDFFFPSRPVNPPIQPSSPLASADLSSPLSSSDSSSFSPRFSDLSSLRVSAHLVEQNFDIDERRSDSLDSFNSHDNGAYVWAAPNFAHRRSIPIPEAILTEFAGLEVRSISGLLSEIHRAFITIDNKLFLWNYHDGSEFYVFDELNQLITAVALVKPKPGIFTDSVAFLLAVSTPLEVVLLAVHFPTGSLFGPLALFPTEFSCSTDEIQILKIASTDAGRIFLCGRDGLVYELLYEASVGWFGFGRSKCRKRKFGQSPLAFFRALLPAFLFGSAEDPIETLAVDQSRRPALLYTLAQSGTISLYSLGKDGRGLDLLCKASSLFDQAKFALQDVNRNYVEDWQTSREFKIVQITPVHRVESERIVLVCLTSHGHRIYLALSNLDSPFPPSLKVHHVRLTPQGLTQPESRHQRTASVAAAFEPGFRRDKSTEVVYHAFHCGDVTALADASRDRDSLLLISREPNSALVGQRGKMLENVECFGLPAKVSDMSELSGSFTLNLLSSSLFARGQDMPLVGLSEFAVQHCIPPRVFHVLTPISLLEFAKARPIEEFRSILNRRRKATDERDILQFIAKYGKRESCAMCLALICANPSGFSYLQPGEGEFERPEGDGRLFGQSPSRFEPGRMADSADSFLSKAARGVLFRFGSELQAPDSLSRLDFSPRLGSPAPASVLPRSASGSQFLTPNCPLTEALALQLSRMLRPLWDWTIVVLQGGEIAVRYSSKQLTEMRGPLTRLQNFLEEPNNWRLITSEAAERSSALLAAGRPPAEVADLIRADRECVESLRSFLSLTIQCVSLLLALADRSTPDIFSQLSDAEFELLRSAKFCDLLTSPEGHALFKSLINSLLRSVAQSAISEKEIAAFIERVNSDCGAFFSQSDLLIYRAEEQIQLAGANSRDREAALDRALSFLKLAAKFPHFPLASVCRQLRDVGAYPSLIDLCLHRINALRRNEVPTPRIIITDSMQAPLAGSIAGGLDASVAGSGTSFLETERLAAIEHIFEALNQLAAAHSDDSTDSSLDPAASAVASSSLLSSALAVCVSSVDREFHRSLYSWLIDRDLKEELFKVQSNYLVEFLNSEEKYLPVLRDYYLRAGEFRSAAKLLSELAAKKTKEFELGERVGFLSRALACARKCAERDSVHLNGHGQSSGLDGELIFQLRDRLDIAVLQQKILSKVKLSIQESQFGGQADVSLSHSLIDTSLALNVSRSSQLRSLVDAAERLEFELLDIEELYLVAQQLGMWEQCLAIFHFSNETSREDVICALWSNLLRSTIASAKQARRDWIATLHDKFIEMAALYKDSDFLFPVEFLTRELEQFSARYRSTQSNAQEGWVARLLVESGVTLHSAIPVYQRLLDSAVASQDRQTIGSLGHSIAELLHIASQRSAAPLFAHFSPAAALALAVKTSQAIAQLPPTAATQEISRKLNQIRSRLE